MALAAEPEVFNHASTPGHGECVSAQASLDLTSLLLARLLGVKVLSHAPEGLFALGVAVLPCVLSWWSHHKHMHLSILRFNVIILLYQGTLQILCISLTYPDRILGSEQHVQHACVCERSTIP